MYYYAYIDSNYKVTGVYALPTEMTADGYIAITAEQYNSGNLTGKYYNPITGNFDEAHGWVCNASEVQYKSGNVTLEEKLDAMDEAIEGKADENHTHAGFAAADHNHDSDYSAVGHTHTEYAVVGHTHTDLVTTETYTAGMSGKADATHTHAEYATTEAVNEAISENAYTHPATHSAEMITGLSDVATSGDYNDLSNKPTIPEQYTHPESHPASMVTGLATVATSGSYNDLSDKPAIPTTLPANGGNADTVDGKNADDFAAAEHTHTQYATNEDVEALETAVSGKANAEHTHTNYAAATHTHAQGDIDGLATALSGKANTSHTHAQSEVTGLSTALNGKVDKVSGKALSTNDYTTAEKNKLAGIAAGANAYAHPTYTAKSSGLYKVTVDGTGHVSGATAVTKADITALGIPAQDTNTTYGNATTSAAGLMSAADKSKLDGISAGANAITVDTALNSTSTNPVQNKVINSALAGKAASNHNHDSAYISKDLLFTNVEGGVEFSYGSGSGKNVLTEISNMAQGFHTIYAIAGTAGNPETAESYRFFIHKTSTTIGWIYAFGADGSIYSNYLAGANTYKGWKTIHDAKRKPLWTGTRYMTADHTVTPSKKLSQCEHGWMLLWSDYDPDTSTVNNTDFCTTFIPNRNWTGGTWNGAAYYCDCPRYTAGTATDSESRVIKVLNVYDNKLVGVANNNAAPRNDVVLRAVYEF